jgi:hypothetical protein
VKLSQHWWLACVSAVGCCHLLLLPQRQPRQQQQLLQLPVWLLLTQQLQQLLQLPLPPLLSWPLVQLHLLSCRWPQQQQWLRLTESPLPPYVCGWALLVLTLLAQQLLLHLHLLSALPCQRQHLHLQLPAVCACWRAFEHHPQPLLLLLLCCQPACAACAPPWGWAQLPVCLLVLLLLLALLLLPSRWRRCPVAAAPLALAAVRGCLLRQAALHLLLLGLQTMYPGETCRLGSCCSRSQTVSCHPEQQQLRGCCQRQQQGPALQQHHLWGCHQQLSHHLCLLLLLQLVCVLCVHACLNGPRLQPQCLPVQRLQQPPHHHLQE